LGLRKLTRTARVELEARVREWYRSLIPGDLHSRIVSVVGLEDWHQQLDGDPEAWQRAVDRLAAELVRSQGDFQRELGWLCSPDARSAYRFGQALAQADAAAALLDRMLSDIPRAGGTVLARGYLERITAARPNLLPRVNQGLDGLQTENPRAAFDVIWSAGDEVHKVDRLFALVDQGGLGAEFLRGLVHGVRDRPLREDELLGAIDRLLRAAQAGNERAAAAAVHLLHGWLRPGRGASGADRLRAHDRVREILPRVLERTLAAAGREPYFWVHLAEDLAAVHPDAGVRFLARALVSRDFNTRSAAQDSLVGLADRFPSLVMEVIGESALSPVSGWMFRTDDFSRLLGAVPEGVVRAWLDRVGVRGARALARHLPPPGLTEESEPFVQPLTEFILSRFEDDDEVFRAFLAGTHAGQVYSADIPAQHEEEAETARQLLGHPLRRVREWAAAEIQSAKRQAQLWRQRDEETAAP
jgi:hypothetical protein